MSNIKNLTIEDGYVMGSVRTDLVGSRVTFPIIEIEDWEEMTEGEQELTAFNAMLENIDWGY